MWEGFVQLGLDFVPRLQTLVRDLLERRRWCFQHLRPRSDGTVSWLKAHLIPRARQSWPYEDVHAYSVASSFTNQPAEAAAQRDTLS